MTALKTPNLNFHLNVLNGQEQTKQQFLFIAQFTSSQSFLACLSLRLCLASDAILSSDSRMGTHMGRKSGM